MRDEIDIAIIGSGAAGLAAGIFSAETRRDLTIVLFDGARTIGSKILVSGGGRCNVTNAYVQPSDFHAPQKVVARILQRFDEQATISWFQSLGVELKQEPGGKLFPQSNQAKTVLTALLQRSKELHVQILNQHRVQTISPEKNGFRIQSNQGTFISRMVILATGGQSLPKSGSDGQGWSMAKNLGHSVTRPYPALVPLVLNKAFIHSELSGVSHEVGLTTRVNQKMVDHRIGSLLWTHFGISGPVVLDASRFWVMANGQGKTVTLSLSCFPHQTKEEVGCWLSHVSREPGRKTVLSWLSHHLPDRVAEKLCSLSDKQWNCRNDQFPRVAMTPLNQLSQEKRAILVDVLTDLSLPVVGQRGWNFAEVTAGGIPLSEINPKTMMSRIIPSLYLIGEMLDSDGRIGGFNFQWAWTTGFIAGWSAALEVEKI